MKTSQTNELTKKILNHLYEHGVYCWRQNTGGIPVYVGGVLSGLRPAAMRGVSDILGVIPPVGRILCVETKVGKDRLRPEQIGFLESVRKCGGVALVVKTFDDYLEQIKDYLP